MALMNNMQTNRNIYSDSEGSSELTPSRRSLLKTMSGIALGAFAFPLLDIPNSFATAPDITHGPRNINKIALTFHGAGGLHYADEILALAAAHQAAISVFAVGTFLQANPNIGKKIITAGHDLGNHTLTHTQMKTISAPHVKSEIYGCAKLLTQDIGYAGKWFRPSGTQYSTALIRKTAQKYGYKQCISYDVDSLDYQDPGAKTVIQAVTHGIKPGSIVSMHFGHKDTVQALPAIFKLLKNKGLTPVTLTELLSPLGISPANNTIN